HYAGSVNTVNADEWYAIVRACASIKSNDGAMFPSFIEFLRQVAAGSPSVILNYLNRDETLLGPFMHAILEGLGRSERKADASDFMARWVAHGRYLSAMARYLRLAPELDRTLAKTVADKAVSVRDVPAIIEMIAVVADKQESSLVEEVFLPCIRC